MAVVFKLRRDSTDVNLLAGENKGWRTTAWNPKAATPMEGRDPPPVVERVDLVCHATSDDNLAAHLQALDDMRMRADRYIRDRTEEDAVWLHVKMDGETGERRALVRRIDMEWLSPEVDIKGYPADHSANVRLAIERAPWWERNQARSMADGSEQAGASIVYDPTGGGSPHDIVGDVPARIRRLTVRSDATGAPLYGLWMGMRSAPKHGTLANFINIWELEVAGATPGTDAARATDATASPGGGGDTKVTVTPGTETWEKRWTIELQDVTANEQDNFGDFLWLLRYKLSEGSSKWEVQLRFGYSGMADDDFVRGPIKEVSNSSWYYVLGGRHPVPIRDFHAITLSDYGDATDKTFAIQIWARRTSGEANLDLDCLCPLPIDEGWLKCWGFDIPAATDGFWVFGESPEGGVQALAYSSGSFTHIASLAAHNFRLPVGDCRIICIYAGPTDHSISTGIYIMPAGGFDYYERWANLRGSE